MSIIIAAFAAASMSIAHAPKDDEVYVSPEEIVAAAPESDWITIDPENIIVMDLPSGTMLIEMRPDLAPNHVARMKTLTRQGFYDGIIFHRVIDGFMAQGGDPTGTGQGGSELPDMDAEFAVDATQFNSSHIIGRDDRAAQIGFVGTVPIATQAPTLPKLLMRPSYAQWGMHCKGVLSMARSPNSLNSANSQFFIMFGDSREGLDQGYTVWGKIIDGNKNIKRISRGEPPTRPTPIVRMRIMADLPVEEQQIAAYLNPSSEVFTDYLNARGLMTDTGYIRDTCAIDVPVRINDEINS